MSTAARRQSAVRINREVAAMMRDEDNLAEPVVVVAEKKKKKNNNNAAVLDTTHDAPNRRRAAARKTYTPSLWGGLVSSVYGLFVSPPDLSNYTGTLCFVYDCDDKRDAMQYPLERKAQRMIGNRLAEHFRQQNYYITEYTVEEDMHFSNPMPANDLLVVLVHDWPTVHEDPDWMSQFMKVFDHPVVPSQEQALFLLEKTRYLSALLEGCPEALLTTFIIDCEDVNMPLEIWAERIYHTFKVDGKFVIKENYSAGKEGVTFVPVTTVAQVKMAIEKVWKATMALQKEHFYVANKFIIQRFEPEFSVKLESRLYFSRGDYLWCMGHIGWIDYHDKPHYIPAEELKVELAMAAKIFTALPQLSAYALVRLDFGPNGKINEIEVFPDMFGGPLNDLTGPQFNKLIDAMVESYKKDMYAALYQVLQKNLGQRGNFSALAVA